MQLAMLGRVGMYFSPIMIAVYPIILFTTKNRFFYVTFLCSLMFMILFKFLVFFQSPVWRDYFDTYQTIFSAPQFY